MEEKTPLDFLKEIIRLHNVDYAIGFIDGMGEMIKVLKIHAEAEKETSNDDVSC